MQGHYWEKATGYEVKISKGFSELKQRAYTASATEPILDYRQPPADKSNMAKDLLIPHDVIADNITLEWLACQFGVS